MSSPSVVPSDPERRSVELADGPASYTDEGAGPPVILVHGLPGSARDFRWLAPHLVPGARVVRVDLPGFGRTPMTSAPDPSPIGRGRFLLDLVDALDLDRPWVIGHSMGGVVACAAAHLRPEAFAGLGLLASPGIEPHAMLRRTPFRALDRLLRLPILGPAMAPLNRWAFAASGFRGYSDGELYRTIHCVARFDLGAHADRVLGLDLPTLVAWCDDDPIIPPEFSTELAEACPDGPRLDFRTGGHNLQKSRAAELAAAVLDLLGPRVAARLNATDRSAVPAGERTE